MGVGCLIERWYVWVGYNLGSVGDEVIVGDREVWGDWVEIWDENRMA